MTKYKQLCSESCTYRNVLACADEPQAADIHVRNWLQQDIRQFPWTPRYHLGTLSGMALD